MRIAFFMRHSGFTRNFETAIRELLGRGHEVELVYQVPREDAEIADRLQGDFPESFSYSMGPVRQDRWMPLAFSLRHAIDYVRYLEPEYRDATKLRARSEKGTPGIVLRLGRSFVGRTAVGRRILHHMLSALDRAIPADRSLTAYLEAFDPDLVLATPLVAGPVQSDLIRSARRIGIPTGLPVTSWDNLTNKGLVRDMPDRIWVWNEAQRQEAIRFHRVRPEQVIAVGAHTYDHWFTWRPSTTREEFCANAGIDPARPIVLYLCSSGFITPNEQPIIQTWLAAVRGSGVRELEDATVMIRPHPSALGNWQTNPYEGQPNVAVYPPGGADPRSNEAKAVYYDSLHHAAVVVGVNTSALIEASIVGRKSLTFPLEEIKDTTEGTLHFHHLLDVNGGPLTRGESMESHLAQLAAVLRDPPAEGWSNAFVQAFIRPNGLGCAAAPTLADEIELAGTGTRPGRGVGLAGALLRPLLLLLRLPAARRTGKQAKTILRYSRDASGNRPRDLRSVGRDADAGRTWYGRRRRNADEQLSPRAEVRLVEARIREELAAAAGTKPNSRLVELRKVRNELRKAIGKGARGRRRAVGKLVSRLHRRIRKSLRITVYRVARLVIPKTLRQAYRNARPAQPEGLRRSREQHGRSEKKRAAHEAKVQRIQAKSARTEARDRAAAAKAAEQERRQKRDRKRKTRSDQ